MDTGFQIRRSWLKHKPRAILIDVNGAVHLWLMKALLRSFGSSEGRSQEERTMMAAQDLVMATQRNFQVTHSSQPLTIIYWPSLFRTLREVANWPSCIISLPAIRNIRHGTVSTGLPQPRINL